MTTKARVIGSLIVCSFFSSSLSTAVIENHRFNQVSKCQSANAECSVSAEMGSADLSLATDSYSFITLNNAYEGLYRLDENNEPVIAGASEDAMVSEDGVVYTIKLREDAKWSNGEPVTAEDYVLAGNERLILLPPPTMPTC